MSPLGHVNNNYAMFYRPCMYMALYKCSMEATIKNENRVISLNFMVRYIIYSHEIHIRIVFEIRINLSLKPYLNSLPKNHYL